MAKEFSGKTCSFLCLIFLPFPSLLPRLWVITMMKTITYDDDEDNHILDDGDDHVNDDGDDDHVNDDGDDDYVHNDDDDHFMIMMTIIKLMMMMVIMVMTVFPLQHYNHNRSDVVIIWRYKVSLKSALLDYLRDLYQNQTFLSQTSSTLLLGLAWPSLVSSRS